MLVAQRAGRPLASPSGGISRGQFYTWLRRYQQHGLEGLKNLKSGSKKPHHRATPPHIVALILRVRAERQYGPIRICLYLQRFHQVYVSVPTIYKILKRHGVPRVSMKRYRPGPHRRREFTVPGQSVQVDVRHLKLGGRPNASASSRLPSALFRRWLD